MLSHHSRGSFSFWGHYRLNEEYRAIVADFGLSRDIYERDYYSSDNKKSKLPVKWMAPESLEKGTYSSKSDVVSYCVPNAGLRRTDPDVVSYCVPTQD